MSARRLIVASIAAAAVVAPATAQANVAVDFPMPRGVATHSVPYAVQHGNAHVMLRIRNDGTRVRLYVRKSTWTHANLLIDTASYACTGEMGHSVCEGGYDLPNGRYRFIVKKLTRRATVVGLKIDG